MPGKFRKFIYAIADSYSIKSFLEGLSFSEEDQQQNQRDPQHSHHLQTPLACALSYSLGVKAAKDKGVTAEDRSAVIEAFNRCVEGMRVFRDKHIQIVTVYIVIQARKTKEVGHAGVPSEVKTERVKEALLARGTGGTSK